MTYHTPREQIRVDSDEDLQRRLLRQSYAETARPAVQSRPLYSEVAPRTGIDPLTKRVLGLVVIILGLLQWLPAARFTVDGWTTWINAIGQWLGFPLLLPSLMGSALILAMVGVGVLYSLIETRCIPFGYGKNGFVFLGGMALVGWLFLTATDVGSTYVGLTAPPASAFQAWQDVAKRPSTAALISFYLTFAPDWFILGGAKLIGVDRLLMVIWRALVRRA